MKQGEPVWGGLWTEQEVNALADKAKSLVRSSEQLQEYTADELMEHALKMGEAAKRIFKAAGMIGDPELAVKLFGIGAKLHAEWRETLLPFTKRVWDDGRKGGRKAKQVSGSSRLRLGSGERHRGGEGQSGSEDDAATLGSTGEVARGQDGMDIPDSEGS